jgi:hypothetical protein
MKGLSWLLLISAILVVLAILYKNREPFALEFIENTESKKKRSSYDQVTNNIKPPSSLGIPPVSGIQTSYRVNLYEAVVPS